MVVIIITTTVPSEMGKICVTKTFVATVTGRAKCLEVEGANEK